jgi:hypothetical protein
MIFTTIFVYSAMAGSFAAATPYQRAAPDNTVVIDSAEKYWYGIVISA